MIRKLKDGKRKNTQKKRHTDAIRKDKPNCVEPIYKKYCQDQVYNGKSDHEEVEAFHFLLSRSGVDKRFSRS
jgi:hypothetical protein